MALFKILKGNEQNLPEKLTEGYAYFTEDKGNFFVDVSSTKRMQLNARHATYDIEEFSNPSGANAAPLAIHSKYLKLSGGTLSGDLYFAIGKGLQMYYSSGKDSVWIQPAGNPNYGIRYFESSVDKMAISASGNNNNIGTADLCINGNGDGTVTIRGNTILHTGNISSHIAGAANYIPKFTSANTLGNSRITDDGTNISLGGITKVTNVTTSTSTTTGAL